MVFSALAVSSTARAEYSDQLKAQVKETEARYAPGSEAGYFRDMGIIARKADDSQLYDLLTEILNNSLFVKMDEYVKSQLKNIDAQLEMDPYPASSKIEALANTQRYYEPSADFLETSAGKSLAGEMARQRQDALMLLKTNPSADVLAKGFSAYQKTGLFSVKKNQEETDLNNLHKQLGCTIGWKKKLVYRYERHFKTEYEEGTVIEEGELTLQTPASEYAAAEWRGPWLYRYKGRDGEGLGTAEAVIKVTRGQYETEILIGAPRLSSTGRFNFPITLNAVKRLVNIKPPRLLPKAEFEEVTVPLTGCSDDGPKISAKVENKNGRVLLG